jgi:hypothetical protein
MGSVPDPSEKPARRDPDDAAFVPPWQKLPDEQLLDMCKERGFGHITDSPPVYVPEELACPRVPPCTDLLANPASVLSDEERWPDHLCNVRFLMRSTEEWASARLLPTTSSPVPQLLDWQLSWPLPVGRLAVEQTLGSYDPSMSLQAPFGQWEEALWALHVSREGNVVDLFGLGVPTHESGKQKTYRLGELRYVIRGTGAQPLRLLTSAQRWWARFRGEEAKGRPAGSGAHWESRIDFWLGLRKAVRAVRAEGDKVTQEKVAERLGYSDRELRRWLKQYGVEWKSVPRIP